MGWNFYLLASWLHIYVEQVVEFRGVFLQMCPLLFSSASEVTASLTEAAGILPSKLSAMKMTFVLRFCTETNLFAPNIFLLNYLPFNS